MQTFSSILEGFKNASRFLPETRSKTSPKKLATPEENSKLGSHRPNSRAPENWRHNVRVVACHPTRPRASHPWHAPHYRGISLTPDLSASHPTHQQRPCTTSKHEKGPSRVRAGTNTSASWRSPHETGRPGWSGTFSRRPSRPVSCGSVNGTRGDVSVCYYNRSCLYQYHLIQTLTFVLMPLHINAHEFRVKTSTVRAET